jgi:hypothetical protein
VFAVAGSAWRLGLRLVRWGAARRWFSAGLAGGAAWSPVPPVAAVACALGCWLLRLPAGGPPAGSPPAGEPVFFWVRPRVWLSRVPWRGRAWAWFPLPCLEGSVRLWFAGGGWRSGRRRR